MTDYLSRAQMVLQRGTAGVDLAYYRVFTVGNANNTDLQEIDKAGYTLDFVSAAVLALDNAVVGEKNGQTVLARRNTLSLPQPTRWFTQTTFRLARGPPLRGRIPSRWKTANPAAVLIRGAAPPARRRRK